MNMALTIAGVLGAISFAGVETGQLLGLQSSGSCGGCPSGLFEIDVDTGEATLLHSFPVSRSEGALAVGPDGTLYAGFSGDIDELVIVDPETGDLTFVGPFGFPDVSGLAFAPDGRLYGLDAITLELFTVNLETGDGTAVGPTQALVGQGLSFSPDGTLYAAGANCSLDAVLFTVDVETGLATEVGPFSKGLSNTNAMAFVGPTLFAKATDVYGLRGLYTLDPLSGAATSVGLFSEFGDYAMGGMAFLPGTGDADGDGDVDHDDFEIFESCFTGPLETEDPLPVECQFLDTDQDNDIDCDDWLDFVNAWTAPEDPPTFPPCEACEGDANEDGLVDPLDSGFVLARFGCPVGMGDPSCDAADQNGDGVVDPLDVGFVLARFGPCE